MITEGRHDPLASLVVQKAAGMQTSLTWRAPYFLQAMWTTELGACVLMNRWVLGDRVYLSQLPLLFILGLLGKGVLP